MANNLVSLGLGRVAVMGAIGMDGFGHELVHALDRRGIAPELLIRSDELPTFTYTKLINSQTGVEDQPRVDFVFNSELPGRIERQLIGYLWEYGRAFDVIFVADQAETTTGGVITCGVRDAIAAIALENPEKVILVDSRIRSHLFRNVIIKPNQLEAESACASLFGEVDYQRLRQTVGSKVLFVTEGRRGVLVVEPESTTLVPTRSIENAVDVCGAGDSFSAGAGVALALTGSAVEAARFGNLVASITIMKKGTGTASPEEVLAAAKNADAGD